MPRNWSVKSILQTLRQTPYIIGYRLVSWTRPLVPGRVLFLSDSRDTLVGNQKALATALTARGYEVRTVLKDGLRARRTLGQGAQLCALMATSPVIVVDDFFPTIYPIKIRKGTQLLQVWHASGAFKTMGFSRAGKPGGPIKGSKTHRNYTAAIVSSEQVRANYAEAFGIDAAKVHATGIPRTDIFFDNDLVRDTAARVRAELDIPKDKKLLLFAPTFRGVGQLKAHYDDSLVDWEDFITRHGDEFVIGYKPHPFVKTLPDIFRTHAQLRDLSAYDNTNELLMATDLLVTDYSSIIFDFALLRRPTVFFCPDLEEYVAARDFYYPYDRYTFGPLARDHASLMEAVTAADGGDMTLDDFVEFFVGACDGRSTARVIDQLIAPFLGTGTGVDQA